MRSGVELSPRPLARPPPRPSADGGGSPVPTSAVLSHRLGEPLLLGELMRPLLRDAEVSTDVDQPPALVPHASERLLPDNEAVPVHERSALH